MIIMLWLYIHNLKWWNIYMYYREEGMVYIYLYLNLFHACVCSTVSSGINAIALVFMEDIIQPASIYFKGGPVVEPKATILSKVIGR